MKIFNTLQEYKAEAKIGDIIALGGSGYIDGLNANCKADFFKVSELESYSGFVYFKKYGGQKQFTTGTQQKVGLISKKDYLKLSKY